MRLRYSPDYAVDLGTHTLPTKKFAMTVDRLLADGLAKREELEDHAGAGAAELLLAHTPEWVGKIMEGRVTLDDEMLMELQWTPELPKAHAKHVAGTLLACRDALESGVGLHAGGGAHHAFADRGEGFCVFNDLAAALIKLKGEGLLERGAVVDLDVHQGNGTAAILSGHEGLFTFSMHQEDIYPFIAGRRSDHPATVDVALPAGTTDAKYLKLLRSSLPPLLERKPGLVVYQAGVDCWEGDLLGGLRLTREGIAERDRMVFESCLDRGIPVAVTLGGGYAERLEDTAALHARTISQAVECGRRSRG